MQYSLKFTQQFVAEIAGHFDEQHSEKDSYYYFSDCFHYFQSIQFDVAACID